MARNYHLSIPFFVWLLFASFSTAKSQSFEVFIRNHVFASPEAKTYLETDILIPSFQLQPRILKDSSLQFTAEIIWFLKAGKEVVFADRYILQSQAFKSLDDRPVSLIDRFRRWIDPGVYVLEVEIKDPQQPNVPSEILRELVVVEPVLAPCYISDIQLVESAKTADAESKFTKGTMLLIPYVIPFYPEHIPSFHWYAEISFPGEEIPEGSPFVLTYGLQKSGTSSYVQGYVRSMKMQVKPMVVLRAEIPIDKLPTGNYDFVLEVKSAENKTLAIKRTFIQRLNVVKEQEPIDYAQIVVENTFVAGMGVEQLKFYLRSMVPKAENFERRLIQQLIKNGQLLAMQQFMLSFWQKRSSQNPRAAWEQYLAMVEQVNMSYSTNLFQGFETDRGRVYLQYGPPNQLVTMPREPGSKPYEVWHYYTTEKGQNNVRFIFVNQAFATNDYDLIHSTMLGEIYNAQWQRLVFDTFTGGNTPTDDGDGIYRDHFGSRSNILFRE